MPPSLRVRGPSSKTGESSGDKCVKVTVYTFPREIEGIKAYEHCQSTRVHEVI